MRIDTLRFGEIEVRDDRVIRFANGIPAFEHLRAFVIVQVDRTAPVYWMQSAEDSGVALPVVDPFALIDNYALEINDAEIEDLCLENQTDLMVLGVTVIPEDVTKMTVNLAAPVLVNTKKGLGKQIVMDDRRYSTRHPVYDDFMQALRGGNGRVGAHAQG